ncbi:MAG: hypothetical protein ACON5A_01410 [Candidatus Comchoanobacterales bacterium]
MEEVKKLIKNCNETENITFGELQQLIFSTENKSLINPTMHDPSSHYYHDTQELEKLKHLAQVRTHYIVIKQLNTPITFLTYCIYSLLPFESTRIIGNIFNAIIPCLYLMLYNLICFSTIKIALRLTRLIYTLVTKCLYSVCAVIGLGVHLMFTICAMTFYGLQAVAYLLLGQFNNVTKALVDFCCTPIKWFYRTTYDVIGFFKCDEIIASSCKELTWSKLNDWPDPLEKYSGEQEDIMHLVIKMGFDLLQPILTTSKIFIYEIESSIYALEEKTIPTVRIGNSPYKYHPSAPPLQQGAFSPVNTQQEKTNQTQQKTDVAVCSY